MIRHSSRPKPQLGILTISLSLSLGTAVLAGLFSSQVLSSCAPDWKAPKATTTRQPVYYIELSGTPPKVRLWGGDNRLAALRSGPWSANKRQGMLSAEVALTARTRAGLAITMDMASGDDIRFAPAFDSFSSVWTQAGRAEWYPPSAQGRTRRTRWRIVVPGGHIPSPVRFSGRVLAPSSHPAVLLEPEDLLAGSAPVRWIHGWLAFPYRPTKWGWASIRASGKAKPLDSRFQVPQTGIYQVLGRGVTRPNISIQGKKLTCRAAGGWTRCGSLSLRAGQVGIRFEGTRRTRLDALYLTQTSNPKPPVPHILDPMRASHLLAATLRHSLDRARCHLAEKIRSAAAWRRTAPRLRDRLAEIMDLPKRPESPSAPKVKTRGSVAGTGFRVEKLWIQGVDGIWASALLYRPNLPGPVPAVLHILGHYRNGKLRGAARILDASLAAAGIAVLAVDNLSFGDRRLPGVHRLEDNHFLGFWHVLAGSSAARVIYGETFRFLDYLWTRSWVDKHRIGVTGSSGGGTASLYLAAMDERVAAASVVAAVSTWDHFGRFRGGDPEQYPKDLVTVADFPTLLALVAPRPLLVAGGTKDDLFPASQGRKAVNRARRIFAMLGAKNAISFHGDSGPHGYKKARRNATLAFFTRLWLGKTVTTCDARLALPAKKLHVRHPPTMPTLLDSARRRLADHEKEWTKAPLERKRRWLARLVGLPQGPVPLAVPDLKFDRQHDFLAGLGRPLRVKLDRDRTLPGLFMHAHGSPASSKATQTQRTSTAKQHFLVIAIADGGWRRFAPAHIFTELGMDLMAMDLSGWGELTPNLRTAYGLRHTWKKVERYHGIESFFAASYLLVSGDSLLAMRTRELLSLVQAARLTFPDRRIGLAAQGPVSSVVALLASILDPHIEALIVLDGMASMKRDMARAVRPLPDLTAPGLLALGDIGDLAGLTRARIFVWTGARDGRGRAAPIPRITHAGREATGLPGAARILSFGNDTFWPHAIGKWAKAWLAR